MPRLRVIMSTEDLRPGLEQIRREFGISEQFPSEIEAEATAAANRDGAAGHREERADHRELPLITIDPKGSKDLDQAFFAERKNGGYRVRYAIADVAAFVDPGGPLDQECWRRRETVYMPDRKSLLLPPVLSEDRASLLPGSDRVALLWTIDLDERGAVEQARLERAVVRSRTAHSYVDAQSAIDEGHAEEPFPLLREIGLLLQDRERERGGVSLNLPTREVAKVAQGYEMRYRRALPIEEWNAQISLLTGHCAATIMLNAGVGILRTLPPVRDRQLATLERAARGLDIDWPEGATLGDVVRREYGSTPESTAFLTQATHSLRGAGYTVIGTADDESMVHGALRMMYAHVTAPLRRLVDRYANEVVLSLQAGKKLPGWAIEALPRLPQAMAEADGRSDAVEGAVLNLAESLVLSGHVGATFRAVVVDVEEDKAKIVLRDPPVIANIEADGVELGATVEVRLVDADPSKRSVTFELP
ncbi:MAG TPA: RNB domain-containing ribonuclease [Actinomycetota bacterium]|jgi:exoribonuclease R